VALSVPDHFGIYAYLAELSEDEANRLIAEARLKAQRDEWSRLEGARKQGIERGMAQGIERGMAQGIERGIQQGIERGVAQGHASLVRNMHRRGLDVAAIAEFTSLPLAQVESYLQA
jgi:flagellar biosynthesis/type III secretory pathway protein FliH